MKKVFSVLILCFVVTLVAMCSGCVEKTDVEVVTTVTTVAPTTKIAENNVKIIGDFDIPENWTTYDEPIKKETFVINMGSDYVYVRVRIKEYMEITPITVQRVYEHRYEVDQHGEFYVFDFSQDDKESALAAANSPPYEGFGYNEFDLDYLKDPDTGKEGWFVRAGERDIQITTSRYFTKTEIGETISLVQGTTRTDKKGHTPHDWKNGVVFEQYILWSLGSEVISCSEWISSFKDSLALAWVYDNTTENGWVYYMHPIGAGESIENIFESVQLVSQPDGDFHYEVHFEIEAITNDEFAKWEDAPHQIMNYLRG